VLKYAKEFILEKPAAGSATAKFILLLDKLNRGFAKAKRAPEPLKLTPQKWYGSRELLVFFRAFRGLMEKVVDQDKIDINSNKDIKDKVNERARIEKERIGDLEEAKNLIPDIVGDFRKRRDDALKGMSPADIEATKSRKDLDWVEHPAEHVKEWQNLIYSEEEKVEHKLDTVLEKREVKKEDPKEKGVGIVDKTKFKDIQDEMHLIIKDIDIWGKILGDDDRCPIPSPDLEKTKNSYLTQEEHAQKLEEEKRLKKAYLLIVGGDTTQKKEDSKEQEYEHMTMDERAKAIEKKFQKSKESFNEIMEKLKNELDKMELQKANVILKEVNEPLPVFETTDKKVLFFSRLLQRSLEVYKRLNSLYNGVIWTRTRKEVVPLEERHKDLLLKKGEGDPKEDIEPKEEPKKEPERLSTLYDIVSEKRKEVVSAIHHFTGIDIFSPESREKASKVKKLLAAFEDKCSSYFHRWAAEMKAQKTPEKTVHAEIRTFAGELIEHATVTEYDKAFPYEQTVARLNKIGNKQVAKWAKKELDDVYNYFKKLYLNPPEKLLHITKNLKKSPQELIVEGLDKILDIFVDYWEKFGEVKEKKVGKPSRLPEKYKNLHKVVLYLQQHEVFPEFSETKSTPESATVPTSQAIMDYIEREWMHQSPTFTKGLKETGAQHIKKWEETYSDSEGDDDEKEDILDEGDQEKTAGKGGKRQKDPKPIVTGIQEIIEEFLLIDFLNDDKETPNDFMKKLFHHIGTGLRQQEGRGNTIDIGTAMSAMLAILKYIPQAMKKVTVSSPGIREQMKRVPASDLVMAKPTPVTRKYLVDEGTGWRGRPKRTDLVMLKGRTPEEHLEHAEKFKKKIDDLYNIINRYIEPDKLGFIYPTGFLAIYDQFQKETKKGPHAPEVGRPPEKEEEKKAELIDFPNQMSYNICSKAVGIRVATEDDFAAILS
jgi:hypothetical protein